MNSEDIVKIASFESKHWWYVERKTLLQNFIKKFSVKGRALDIGAAAGYYSSALKDLGLNVTSLENDLVGVKICQSLGLNAVLGNAEALQCESNSMDLITMMDVLEHLQDDKKAIKEASRVLRIGGYLYLTVPVGMELWSAHDLHSKHFRRYEFIEIERLLQDENIKILAYRYWNVILRPVLMFRRKLFKASDISLPSKPINLILSIIIKLERFLPISNMRGVSLIVIGQKTNPQ